MSGQAKFIDEQQKIFEQQKEAARRRSVLILERIGRLQRKKGGRVTIKEIAEEAGITRQGFYKIIEAETITPKTSTLHGLEDALQFKRGELLCLTYGFLNEVPVPGRNLEPKIPSLYTPDIKSTPQEDVLCDHIGPWCARCLGYLEPFEVGAYRPYSRIPSVDDPWLEVALDKALGWTVPVHRDGCLLEGFALDAAGAGDLSSLLLLATPELENLANITFHQGKLIRNIVIRLILSRRCEDEQEAAIQLVKAAISNAGSNQSEVIGPILDSYIKPSVLNNYQKVRLLLALGNRARNIGRPDVAEKECYGQARHILYTLKKAKKARHALERRELSVRQSCASLAEAENLIATAREDAETYGVRTTLNYIALDNFRNNDYVHAEDNFRVMLDYKELGGTISWWHKMAGWLGLGATLYANNSGEFKKALYWCLKAEYVSAMLGLHVDVTRGISEQLLGPRALLSPSAVVRKIGKEKNVLKEKMAEIRHTALIESRLQEEVLAA